jgi:hypothetical protein
MSAETPFTKNKRFSLSTLTHILTLLDPEGAAKSSSKLGGEEDSTTYLSSSSKTSSNRK